MMVIPHQDMTQCSNTYETIFLQVSGIQCSFDEVRNVKSRYQHEIKSKRRLDAIRSLPELLRILEKRDYLSPENVDPLMDIAVAFRQTQIVKSINDYINNNRNNIKVHDTKSDREYSRTNSVLPQIATDPKVRAYDLIATHIGQKWQDLARALEIPEGHIDELSNVYPRISDRVHEILRYHEQDCDRRQWLSQLLLALRKARRADLSLKVQNIFDTC